MNGITIGRVPWQVQRPNQYRLAAAGLEPAEALTTRDRSLLLSHLSHLGITDDAIARITHTSDYTVARILGRDEYRKAAA